MNRAEFIKRCKAKGWLLWRSPNGGNITTFKCQHIGCPGAFHATEDRIARGHVPGSCKLPHKKGYAAHVVNDYEAIRDLLRSRRIALGLSQELLEAGAGLAADHIGKLEISDRLPRLPTFWAWAQALGYDIALVPKPLPDQMIAIIAESSGQPDPERQLPDVLRAPVVHPDDKSRSWLQHIA